MLIQLREPKHGKKPTIIPTIAKIPKIKLAVFILNLFIGLGRIFVKQI
jgi:hypothetical protein